MSIINRSFTKCPLCHSDVALLDFIQDGRRMYYVTCSNMDCGLTTLFYPSPEDAISHWHLQEEYAESVQKDKVERV